MSESPLSCYADSLIASLGAEPLTDHLLLSLQTVFTRNLVLAALDLIDRDNVLKCTGPASYHYQVLGSTATYSVFLDLPGPTPAYCSCPAFSYLVLSSETHLMCKHILAAHLARQMGRLVDRPMSVEELASALTLEYSV